MDTELGKHHVTQSLDSNCDLLCITEVFKPCFLDYTLARGLFIAPGVLPFNSANCTSLLWARPKLGLPFRPRPVRSLRASWVALLLLLGGDVSLNPGPSSSRRHPPQVSLGCINACSAVSKTALLHDLISERDIDILVLTETWVTSETLRSVYADLAPPGYKVFNAPRMIVPGGPTRGGGVAVVFRDSITVRPVTLPNVHLVAFEMQVVRIISPPSSHTIIAVYRPPPNLTSVFFDELSDVITAARIISGDNIIVVAT